MFDNSNGEQFDGEQSGVNTSVDEWEMYDPCPWCGGRSFRRQFLSYDDVEADENGNVKCFHGSDWSDTTAVFCNTDGCKFSEEPLVSLYDVVPSGGERDE